MTDLYAEPVTTVAVKEPKQVPVKKQPPPQLTIGESINVLIVIVVIIAVIIAVL
jgi:hypothetical protein